MWFKTANVLATGDTFTNGRYPNIDFANGGNIKGMIAATDAYLKLTNAKSRIVPGHGPVADKAALTEYRAMLVTARDRMDKLVKDGKSEADVLAAKPFADLDKKWAPTELASQNFIRVVYHSLADKPDAGKEGAAEAPPEAELSMIPKSGNRFSDKIMLKQKASMNELFAIAGEIGAKLIARKETIAVAESSTGGLISAALLSVPGASAYFLGGAVVYTRDARRLLMEIPNDAMKGIRSASEPYAQAAGNADARTFRHHVGAVRDRRDRAQPATATAMPPAIAAWRSRGRWRR